MHLRALLACVLALASGVHAPTMAAQHGNAMPVAIIDLPAQPLGRSINALARQAGVAISVDADLVAGHSASALNGRLTLTQALERLLQGTGLVAVEQVGGGYVIRGSPAATATADAQGDTIPTLAGVDASMFAGTHQHAELPGSAQVGGKSGQLLREIPKSVSIMTRERIEMQHLGTLQEVLLQATGVSAGAFSPLDTYYYARGMRLQTYQFDGGAPAYVGGLGFNYTPDTATLDRVELLRGVDGVYSGAGEPGGVINLVRKRPGHERAVDLDLSVGDWNHRRATLDVSAPLALEGRLRGRAVASQTDRRYWQDRYVSAKQVAYGVLEFDAGETTRVTLGALHERREDDGYSSWSGISRYSDGGALDLPRGYSIAPDWSRWHTRTSEWFATLDQHYGQSGNVQLNLARIAQDTRIKQALAWGAVDRATGTGAIFYGTEVHNVPVQRLADLSASGGFAWFGRSHRYTVGADASTLDGAGQTQYGLEGLGYADAMPLDYASFDPASIAEPASHVVGRYPTLEQSQQGYYGALKLQLSDPLRLIVSGRLGRYRYRQVYRTEAGDASVQAFDDTRFIPSAALSYDLSGHWTTYLSYGETFKPQSHLLEGPLPGRSLAPMQGDSLELGLKGDVFAGMTAALAVYRLTRNGQGNPDPRYPGFVIDDQNGSVCCYVAQGEVEVLGVDAELSGAIAPGWLLFGGYTYITASTDGISSVVATLGRTPRHQLKLWTSYRLPGALSRWTLNGGVIAQSDTAYVVPYGGMTLWNAALRFEIDPHWSLSLSGDNLTDKRYWQSTGTLNNQNVRGSPRMWLATLSGRW
ncbi:TonB-dependent siderophore receptor [Luteimonas sp. RIT-PG2_3]